MKVCSSGMFRDCFDVRKLLKLNISTANRPSLLLLASGATLTLLWREQWSLCVVVNKETCLLSEPPDPPLSVLTPPTHDYGCVIYEFTALSSKPRPSAPTESSGGGDIWETVWEYGQYCGNLLTYSDVLGAGKMGAQASCMRDQAHRPHMPHILVCKS